MRKYSNSQRALFWGFIAYFIWVAGIVTIFVGYYVYDLNSTVSCIIFLVAVILFFKIRTKSELIHPSNLSPLGINHK